MQGPPIPTPQTCSINRNSRRQEAPGERHPEVVDEPECGAVLISQDVRKDGLIHVECPLLRKFCSLPTAYSMRKAVATVTYLNANRNFFKSISVSCPRVLGWGVERLFQKASLGLWG